MDLFQFFTVLFAVILLSIFIFRVIIEPLYVFAFNKPLYVHLYLYTRKLNTSQRQFLKNDFPFYQKLSDKKKKFFEHRVASFIVKYQFVGKGGFVVSDQVKIMLAATFVMLTFGMRHYLIDNFNKIIIYSEHYYSMIKKQYHKGEFNPRMKVLVFSWKDFEEGLHLGNDNLNLGLHEFSHALYFHGLSRRDQSSVVFSHSFEKIKEYLINPEILKKLIESNYFRIYAYTNQVEFVAVILEHFFETPQEFKKEFPELYDNVRMMINFDENV
jgi:hypothetical protein